MKSFLNFLKIIALVLICLGAAFAVVWPLWKFATKAPVIYTWVILGLLLILVIFFIVLKIVKKHAK